MDEWGMRFFSGVDWNEEMNERKFVRWKRFAISQYSPQGWHRLQSIVQILGRTRGVTLPGCYPILDELRCQDDAGRQQWQREHPAQGMQLPTSDPIFFLRHYPGLSS